MTVSNQTQFVNLAGNGAAAQVFPFAFRCLLSSYLVVEFRSTTGAVPLALNVDYTVTLNPDQEANPGGEITLTDAVLAAPTAATTVSIISAAPNVQQLDLPTGGPFSAAAVEAQLDSLTQQVQQLRDALSSALRGRPGDTLDALPLAASRANTLQGYDASGAPLLYANAISISLVSQVQGPFGSAALPGYAFAGRTGDGMYSPSVGSLAWSIGGVQRLRLDANGLQAPLGAVATPAYAFGGDADTGVYSPAANTWAVTVGGVRRLQVSPDGRLSGTALHNNAGSVTGSVEQYIASGTYTPVATGVTNITSTVGISGQWTRVGNVVTVSARVNINATAGATSTSIRLALPIATSLPADDRLCGVASANTGGSAPNVQGTLFGDVATGTATLIFQSGTAGNFAWYAHFTYVIT